MQKSTFDKNQRRTGGVNPTKPPARQEGKEPDPAGKAGERASADSATHSTPKAGAVKAGDKDD